MTKKLLINTFYFFTIIKCLYLVINFYTTKILVMKQILSLFLFLCIGNLSAFAQTDVTFNIFHKLGDQDFAFNQSVENDMEHSFQIDRLEYYLSQLSIVHDGGMETSIADLYVLVNASEATSISLGNYNINEVEAMRFYVGVNEQANHNDPASYANDHPLAPKFPSMHWGWVSGYRFVALEGMSGAQIDQNMEIHALGDQNYFQTDIPVTAIADDGILSIDLNADYIKALKSIELNSGVLNHGFDEEALTLLLNFRSNVFIDANTITSNFDLTNIDQFQVYPNPSDGNATLNLSLKEIDNYQISIQTILGTEVNFFEVQNLESTIALDLKHQGMYFISLIKDGKTILTEKLIVD